MERTDTSAPVSAHSEIVVLASPRRVWAVLADIEGWHAWNPAVREAWLDGDLESGTTFRYAAGPGTNSCRLTDVDSPWSLSWTGHSMGVGDAQAWQLETLDDGCQVRTQRSMSGIIARAFSGRLQQWLQANLDTWVHLLKLESEARSGEGDEADVPTDDDADQAVPSPTPLTPPPPSPGDQAS